MSIKKIGFGLLGASTLLLATPAFANGLIIAPNGLVQIGINDDGSLDANTSGSGNVGIGYNFTGQGGRTGFQDALSPGCFCEAWGVSYNGTTGGQVGQTTGNQGIAVSASSSGTTTNATAVGTVTTFTSNTVMSGLGVTQTFSLGTSTATGALFQNSVTITNSTGSAITNLRYARAMDWDVPPTEFSEYVTIKGTATTPSLVNSTDDGFANANPLTAVNNTGIMGPNDSDGTTGIRDHGALFVFDFGSLGIGETFTFNIFYGAGANESDALALLGSISPELYSLGQSSLGGTRRTDLPTFVFAFNGVGGEIVVPPTGVPEPLTLSLFGAGLAGAVAMHRRRRRVA